MTAPWEGEAPAEPHCGGEKDPMHGEPKNPARQEPRPPEPLPQRAHPAHGVKFFTSSPTIVFVTVCTKDRKRWLASAEYHDLLRKVWSGARAWLVGRYVLMPDHAHFFCAPGEPEFAPGELDEVLEVTILQSLSQSRASMATRSLGPAIA